MSKQNCPHCSMLQEINHDDGYGYTEDVRHSQQCTNCEKIFWFEVSFSPVYYMFKNEEGDN